MSKLAGKRIVFSGFRDEDLLAKIEVANGKVMSAVSGLTDIVIYKGKESAKVNTARDSGKDVMTIEQFVATYFSTTPKKKSQSPVKSKTEKPTHTVTMYTS